jgi:hypothetical protein
MQIKINPLNVEKEFYKINEIFHFIRIVQNLKFIENVGGF